jgi:hypothetical protein
MTDEPNEEETAAGLMVAVSALCSLLERIAPNEYRKMLDEQRLVVQVKSIGLIGASSDPSTRGVHEVALAILEGTQL